MNITNRTKPIKRNHQSPLDREKFERTQARQNHRSRNEKVPVVFTLASE